MPKILKSVNKYYSILLIRNFSQYALLSGLPRHEARRTRLRPDTSLGRVSSGQGASRATRPRSSSWGRSGSSRSCGSRGSRGRAGGWSPWRSVRSLPRLFDSKITDREWGEVSFFKQPTPLPLFPSNFHKISQNVSIGSSLFIFFFRKRQRSKSMRTKQCWEQSEQKTARRGCSADRLSHEIL